MLEFARDIGLHEDPCSGASMSGDLKHPSKAIPKGTLGGLGLTFVVYTLVILAMAATITRESFYNDVNIVQDVSRLEYPSFCNWLFVFTNFFYIFRPTFQAYLCFLENLLRHSFPR